MVARLVAGLLVLMLAGVTGVAGAQGTRDSVLLLDALASFEREAGIRFSYEASALGSRRVARPRGGYSKATWTDFAQQLPAAGISALRANKDGTLYLLRAESIIVPRAPTGPMRHLTILDEDGKPLGAATIQCPSGRGWVADDDGKVLVPADAWSEGFEVRYVGLTPLRFPPGSNPPGDGRLRFRSNQTSSPEVTVLARLSPKPVTLLGANAGGASSAISSAVGLPPNTLANFGFVGVAGATQVDGRSSTPALRGSLPTETLVTLDGLPIYHLDHYFGLFPNVDPLLVQRLALHRSHYPANYGGATGGLLAIDSRVGQKSGIEVDLSQLSAAGRGTLKQGPWRALVDVRSSLGNVASGNLLRSATVDLNATEVQTPGVQTNGLVRPEFNFADGYVNLGYRSEDSTFEASVQAFGSRDRYDYRYEQEQLFERVNDRNRGRSGSGGSGSGSGGSGSGGGGSGSGSGGSGSGEVSSGPTSIEGRYSETSRWENTGLRASLRWHLPRHSAEISAHRSAYVQSFGAEGRVRAKGRRGGSLTSDLDNSLGNEVVDRQVNLVVRNTRDAERAAPPPPSTGLRHHWETGLQLQELSSTANFEIDAQRPLDAAADARRVHAYTQHELHLGSRLALTLGIRASQRLDAEQFWLSPRVKVGYTLAGVSLTGGYSITQQALRSLKHENQFGQTYTVLIAEPLRPVADGVAHNYTAGFAKAWPRAQLLVEGYHRELGGVLAALSTQVALPRDAELVSLRPSFLSVVGEGEVQGVDVDFRYGTKRWSGQLAYTLARSRRRFAEVADDAWQRAPDDRRHRLATSHEWQQRRWTLGVAYEMATGLSYVDLNVLTSEAGDRALANPEDYLRSLPAYRRVDVTSAYRVPLAGGQLRLGLRLYNALDRANVTQRQYVVGVGSGDGQRRAVAVGTDVSLLGRLVIGELGWRF